MSLKIKTFIIILIAILIPSIMTNLLVYSQSEKSIINQTSVGIMAGMNQSVSAFDINLNLLVSLSRRMQYDAAFIEAIQSADSGGREENKNKEYVSLYRQLNDYLQTIKAPNIVQNIDSLYLYLPGSNTVITTSSTYYEDVDMRNISFVLEDDAQEGRWYESKPINFYTLQGRPWEESLITYNQRLYDKEGNVIAICALNLEKSALNDVYSNSLMNLPGGLATYDAQGALISSDNLQNLSQDELMQVYDAVSRNAGQTNQQDFMMPLAESEYLVVYTQSQNTGWTYATIARSADFLSGLYEIKKLLIWIICMMIIAVPVISIIIARVVFKPTETLSRAMQEIQNRNLDVRIEEVRSDEYKKVYDGFNNMVVELNGLIQNLTNEKMLNKEAKIRLLQEQINPHFLYNTLDSIYSIAQLQDVPEISRMVFALSQFFRVSLSGGKEIVLLKEALEIVESYLTVQNIRFSGKFDFTVDVPSELMDCKVLKLVLQPLAENAIYHGLEAKKAKGLLKIRAYEEDGMLILSVEDNGAGMTEEKVNMLRQSMVDNSTQEEKNFATKNLNMQIKLRYGAQFGIEIYSKEGEGTSVFVKMPLIRKSESDPGTGISTTE